MLACQFGFTVRRAQEGGQINFRIEEEFVYWRPIISETATPGRGMQEVARGGEDHFPRKTDRCGDRSARNLPMIRDAAMRSRMRLARFKREECDTPLG